MTTKINPPPLNPNSPDFNKRMVEVIRLMWVKMMGADGSSDGLPITDGGTGAGNPSDARQNLGLEIGVDIQGHNTNLDKLASLTHGLYNLILSDGSQWQSTTLSDFSNILGGDDELAFLGATQTLTNKTISIDDNTISGISASSFILSDASGNMDGSASQKAIPSGDVVGTTDTQTLTGKTIDGDDNTFQDISTNSLKDRTGLDIDIVTGTAGLSGNLSEWNSDGDIVDSGYKTSDFAAAATAPEISSQAGVPGTTPLKIGDINVNTTGPVVYIATGTASSADWTIVS